VVAAAAVCGSGHLARVAGAVEAEWQRVDGRSCRQQRGRWRRGWFESRKENWRRCNRFAHCWLAAARGAAIRSAGQPAAPHRL